MIHRHPSAARGLPSVRGTVFAALAAGAAALAVPAPRAAAQAPALAPAFRNVDASGSAYAALLEAARRGDAGVDYSALRESYAESPDYDPMPPSTGDEFMDLISKSDDQTLLRRSTVAIDSNFFDLDAHMAKGVASRRLGDVSETERQKAIVSGMVKAIAATGNGETPETALRILSVNEEHGMLTVLGDRATQQTLTRDNAGRDVHKVDIVNVESGRTATVFFNVDRPMKAYEREILGKLAHGAGDAAPTP